MINEFRICDRCKATNVNTLIPKLKEIDSACKIKVGCQNLLLSVANLPLTGSIRTPTTFLGALYHLTS